MKTKTAKEARVTVETVLDEAIEAAGAYLQSLARYREAARNHRDEGELGAVASALFLLKLKAESAYEQLDEFIESLPDN
jgi:hypothetical protein